jgi:serine/threonine protein kinase
MFHQGSIVDNKYLITGLCSDQGGMGTVLFVSPVTSPTTRLVLKYCKQPDDETKNRFRREVRVMQSFDGNPYVAPIIDANFDNILPYFVMPYFEDGDLTRHSTFLRQNLESAEICFNLMIDCIEQLHSKNIFHRDIKPQNFLVGNGKLVVSDLGLCTQHDSPTAFTRNSAYWGTPGYMPPEFANGGFRNADATGDIFMLGVTFLNILTGSESIYLASTSEPRAIFVVIEKACASDKSKRYQSLTSLRQSLALAFAVILGRVSGSGGIQAAQQAIVDRWQNARQPLLAEVNQFIDELLMLPSDVQQRVCVDMPIDVFQSLAEAPLLPGQLGSFIQSYQKMSEHADYGWSFAEVIANNMAILFRSTFSFEEDKAEALKTAIIAAQRQNRFAAMDTCKKMIASVQDAGLAHRIFEIMMSTPAKFFQDIDPLTCRSRAIQEAIALLKSNAMASSRHQSSINPFSL